MRHLLLYLIFITKYLFAKIGFEFLSNFHSFHSFCDSVPFVIPFHYRYNKPLQASVRAVTNGTLWALRREDFRGILTSEFSNLSSLKLLRSVDLLSRLTILQLSLIADALSEVSFTNGQTIVDKVN